VEGRFSITVMVNSEHGEETSGVVRPDRKAAPRAAAGSPRLKCSAPIALTAPSRTGTACCRSDRQKPSVNTARQPARRVKQEAPTSCVLLPKDLSAQFAMPETTSTHSSSDQPQGANTCASDWSAALHLHAIPTPLKQRQRFDIRIMERPTHVER
jgi:hypothetical protein